MTDSVKEETSSLSTQVTNTNSATSATTPSGTGTSNNTTGGAKTGTQLVFIHKLYNMLEDESLNHLIWWCENSDDSFMLIPNTDFSKLLSVYFKHSNILSFVRQLNMYGFHKVNDSVDPTAATAPAASGNFPVTTASSAAAATTGTVPGASTSTATATGVTNSTSNNSNVPTNNANTATSNNRSTPVPSLQQEEGVTTWEFKHNSGFFKKGDAENLKNIKRRSSKNISREISSKQLNKIQNYIPKSYEEEDFVLEGNEMLLKLNELNYNFNIIKNDHLNLSKKYDMALEDLKKTNYDLLYLLDLIKDLTNSPNPELEGMVNRFKANILQRNSNRENDLLTLNSMTNSHIAANPTSMPPSMHNFSRVNSFDSVIREPLFINKDIRFSSISSSSKRHHSIMYDPLTTDPFTSRHNSQTELRQPQFSFSPVSPGQPPPPTSLNRAATPLSGQQQQQLPQLHYFQETHAHLVPEQHHQQSQPPPPHLHPSQQQPYAIHRTDSNNSLTSLHPPGPTVIPPGGVAHQQQQQQQQPPPQQLPHTHSHPLPPHLPAEPQHQPSNTSVMSYNSATSTSSIPLAAPRPPTLGLGGTSGLPSLSNDPRTRENSFDNSSNTSTTNNNNINNGTGSSIPPPNGTTTNSSLNKLQPPFESGELSMRRGRSDSVSDRLLFKRAKS